MLADLVTAKCRHNTCRPKLNPRGLGFGTTACAHATIDLPGSQVEIERRPMRPPTQHAAAQTLDLLVADRCEDSFSKSVDATRAPLPIIHWRTLLSDL